MKDKKPSDFMKHPFESVLKQIEPEVIARNIMVILKRTGNEFRELTWEEYKEERLKDGDFSMGEEGLFNQVIEYCKSEATAAIFSKEWE